jgi:hypothetical protein
MDTPIEDLETRDKRLVFALSIIEQQQHWCMERMIDANKRAQKFQKQLVAIRDGQEELRKELQETKEANKYSDWKWKLFQGITVIILAGFVSALFRSLFDK